MDANLEFQYEQVVTWLEQYQEFMHRMVQKSTLSLSFSGAFRAFWTIQRGFKPLSGKTPEWFKRRVEEIAEGAEDQSEFFPVLISDYPINSLSALLTTRFAGYDYVRLKKWHEVKKNKPLEDPIRWMMGIYVVIGTLLLNTVPESVVERFIPYTSFEQGVFWFVAGSLALIFLSGMRTWLSYERARRDQPFIGEVLSYISIKQGE